MAAISFESKTISFVPACAISILSSVKLRIETFSYYFSSSTSLENAEKYFMRFFDIFVFYLCHVNQAAKRSKLCPITSPRRCPEIAKANFHE